MLKKYQEILFGVLLGAGMWLIDAAMHIELGLEAHSNSTNAFAAHSFWLELFQPHPTTLIYRLVYFALAIAFGVYLWRANWRERELRAFEQAIIRFQRQLDSPVLRILTRARQLQLRNSVQLDQSAADLAGEISHDARLLDELAQTYSRFSEQVLSGNTAAAINTLQNVESKFNLQNETVKS